MPPKKSGIVADVQSEYNEANRSLLSAQARYLTAERKLSRARNGRNHEQIETAELEYRTAETNLAKAKRLEQDAARQLKIAKSPPRPNKESAMYKLHYRRPGAATWFHTPTLFESETRAYEAYATYEAAGFTEVKVVLDRLTEMTLAQIVNSLDELEQDKAKKVALIKDAQAHAKRTSANPPESAKWQANVKSLTQGLAQIERDIKSMQRAKKDSEEKRAAWAANSIERRAGVKEAYPPEVQKGLDEMNRLSDELKAIDAQIRKLEMVTFDEREKNRPAIAKLNGRAAAKGAEIQKAYAKLKAAEKATGVRVKEALSTEAFVTGPVDDNDVSRLAQGVARLTADMKRLSGEIAAADKAIQSATAAKQKAERELNSVDGQLHLMKIDLSNAKKGRRY